MHSFRLCCRRINFVRNTTCLLENHVKPLVKTSCLSNYSTESPKIDEADQFKAAVLHPKKQNLTIETLVLPESAASGMVRINQSISDKQF